MREQSLRDGTIITGAGIFLLLFFGVGCFFNDQKTQYIVIQDGKKLRPYAKVIYRVSTDKQEVDYWIETPGRGSSQLHKLKKCTVTDPNNWQGEADYILLWKIRVAMVNGIISAPGEGLVNVNRYKWHLKTDPSPGPLSTLIWYGLLFLSILGIIAVTLIVLWIVKRGD